MTDTALGVQSHNALMLHVNMRVVRFPQQECALMHRYRNPMRGGAIDLGFAQVERPGENSRVGNGAGIQPTRFPFRTLGPDLVFWRNILEELSMPDFYADHPFPEIALMIADPERFCSVGDTVAGMKPNSGVGRVEKFLNGGILVHPVNDRPWFEGDTLVSATSTATIEKISNVTMD